MDTNKPYYHSEYIFSAAEIKEYLDKVANELDLNLYDLAIRIIIKRDQPKVFSLEVEGVVVDKAGEKPSQLLADRITGCPRPPSC